MTAIAHPANLKSRRRRAFAEPLFLALGALILVPAVVALGAAVAIGRPLPWQFAAPVVTPHILAALLMLALGLAQLALPKGDRRHRLIGYAWCVLFATVCVSGLFVRLAPGPPTLIHQISSGFAIGNLLLLPVIVWSARTRRRKLHRFSTLLAFWFMIQPGLLAYIPTRAIGALVFGLFH